ncbi:MAG: sugar ABC transporter ATP-binding protein, partial [Pseudothermotoga sp.]|nr:sugar ABC transporter ATP-binding protein [Pseudothermotoga sp.]
AIYLWKRCDSGSITFLGKPYQARSSYDAVRMGIVMVPENRRTEGLILNETIKNNLTLPALRFASRFGFLSERTLIQMSENVVKRLSIKLSSLMQPVRTLSGGNQQKVSVGKWFTVTAKLWIFDEPTQGIDVDAKREIYEIFGEIVAQGAGVWFISSDLRELIALSDRIYVMRKGEIIFEQKRPFDQGEILARMLGSDGK